MAGNIPGAYDELRDALTVNSGENANSGGLVSFCYIVGIKRMHRSCYQPFSLNHFDALIILQIIEKPWVFLCFC